MFVRSPIAITALAATFAAGVVASHFIRDARADAGSFASTVYVPSDGITLRTLEGHVIARLSYDAHGGVFELYDENERPSTRVRADSFAPPPPTSSPSASPTPTATARTPTRKPDLGF
jgi:hypothetical protein